MVGGKAGGEVGSARCLDMGATAGGGFEVLSSMWYVYGVL